MSTIKQGEEFLNKSLKFKNTSERIEASREVKSLILGINEIYKTNKDQKLMDLMKDLTVVKQKIEKRLKGRPLTSWKLSLLLAEAKELEKQLLKSLFQTT